MADITGKDTVVKGVNSPNNYIRSEAHLIDGTEVPDVLSVATHDLFDLPGGVALTGIKVIALDDTSSSGSATLQFKVGSTAVGSAIGKAALAEGAVATIDVNGVAYDTDPQTISMTVGTAALTGVKLLVVAEYLPVLEFITAG